MKTVIYHSFFDGFIFQLQVTDNEAKNSLERKKKERKDFNSSFSEFDWLPMESQQYERALRKFISKPQPIFTFSIFRKWQSTWQCIYSRRPKSERSDFGILYMSPIPKRFGFRTTSESQTIQFGYRTFGLFSSVRSVNFFARSQTVL